MVSHHQIGCSTPVDLSVNLVSLFITLCVKFVSNIYVIKLNQIRYRISQNFNCLTLNLSNFQIINTIQCPE